MVGRGQVRKVERATGTIVRLTKLTDTSLIVHWMTAEWGLLKTVARGARRAKSSFAGRLDLFISAEFEWSRSRSSDLHSLREVSVGDYREGLRTDYRKAVVASYFGQLLEQVLQGDHPEPQLYDLLQRGLGFLVTEEASMKALLHFESETAGFLGLGKGGFGAILNSYGKMPASRDHCLDLLSETC